MNNSPETELNTALSRLLDGESIETLSRAYPSLKDELVSYLKFMAPASALRTEMPSEDGPRRTLASMRLSEARAGGADRSAYARISYFIATYRTAIVLPALVLMLVATGAYTLPSPAPESLSPISPERAGDLEMQSGNNTQLSTIEDSGTSEARMMKSAPSVLSAAPEEAPAPQIEDQDLAGIYADEFKQDQRAAQSDKAAAAYAADDSESLEGYHDTYDAQSI